VDLPDPKTGKMAASTTTVVTDPVLQPAWHGTLLPESDADVWLAAGFPLYERIVALENGLRARHDDGKLTAADRERLELALFGVKTEYEQASRSRPEVALTKTTSDLRTDEWYRVAANKGVLLLAHLRKEMGAEKFDHLMDDFGRAYAGKAVRTEQFMARVREQLGKDKSKHLDKWLDEVGLPVALRGGPYSVVGFLREPEETLIVVGTGDEGEAQKEAAELLQKAIRVSHSNFTVPIRTDREVSEEELKTHHLLLIGRPDSNSVVQRFKDAVPVAFGSRSFKVGADVYAHARSGLIAAGENPLQRRFSLVVIAGLEGSATRRIAPLLAQRQSRPAEVVVFPYQAATRSLVVTGKKE
jgi:hypothetical protein